MHKKFDCQGNSSSSSSTSSANPTTSNKHTITVDDFIRTSNVTASESEYFFRQNLLLNNKFFLAHTSNFYSSRHGAPKPTAKPTQLSSSSHRIYENVCSQCSSGGQSQNLSVSDGCLRSKCAVCNALDVQDVATHTENIYEDICERCNSINSGGEKFCEKCSLVSSVKLSKPSILTGLLSSFRGKTNRATGKPPVKPPYKPVIVHNIDTAFKTNQSFDLGEICRLKAKSNSSHIYGKLRKSDDNLLLRRPATHTPQRLIKSAVSESNFSQWQPELNNNNSSSATQLYENLDIFIHSCESPCVAVDDDISASISRKSSVSSSTNNLHYRSQNINNSAVIAWMTSLSKYTVDYAEDYLGVCMVKCIPSNSFASCCGVSGSLSSVVRARIQLSSRKSRSMRNVQRSTVDFERQVDEFKCNLMENNSKRSAIYFKEARQEFEPIYVVVKDSFLDEEAIAAREAILRSSEEEKIELNEECFLRPKNSHLQRILDDEKILTTMPIATVNRHRTPTHKCKAAIRQRDHMTDVLISVVGLNKSFILTFNDKQLYMLLYQLCPANDNQLSQFYSHYNKYLKHLISLYSPSKQGTTKKRRRSRHLPAISCDKNTQVVVTPPIVPSELNKKNKISDFEVQPCDASHNKREINDFVVKLQRSSPVRRRKFEDFEKTIGTEVLTPRQQLIQRQAKMLSDFELRAKQPTVTSNDVRPESMTNGTKYSHSLRQVNNNDEDNNNNSEENIYQPIWKFRTVGFAAEESYADGGELLSDDGLITGGGDDSDEGCSLYDSIEFYDEDLETPAEWEVAEEFRYATKFEECQDMVDLEIGGGPPVYDPYQRICVLYSWSEPKRNQLIYDKSQPFYDVESASDLTKEYSYEFIEKNDKCTRKRNTDSEVVVVAASVQAWKLMLRSISYLEDEEDVVSVLCVLVNYCSS